MDEEPEDEVRPYLLSSKQLEARFVLLADGGAQHSVELAWDGEYGRITPCVQASQDLHKAEIKDLHMERSTLKRPAAAMKKPAAVVEPEVNVAKKCTAEKKEARGRSVVTKKP